MESQSFPRGSRRRYSAAFKSRLVALACEPGASVAELARTHQISPSLLNRWRHAAGYPASRRKALSAETSLLPSTPAAFVPVELIESPGEPPIHLELTRGKTSLRMILPRSEAERCFQLLQTSLASVSLWRVFQGLWISGLNSYF